MTILALNPGEKSITETIQHIDPTPAPSAHKIADALRPLVSGVRIAPSGAVYSDSVMVVLEDGVAKWYGVPAGAHGDTIVAAIAKAAGMPAPVRHDCLECGASYTVAGKVEAGGMGCVRCNGH